MKNILILSALFYPQEKGGAEVVARRFAYACKERGYNVHVISLHRSPDSVIIDNDITLTYWKNKNKLGLDTFDQFSFLRRLVWHVYDLFSCAYENKLRSYIEAHGIDTVYTHNIKGFGMRGVVRVCADLGIDWVHTAHDIQYINPSGLMYLGREFSLDNSFFITSIYKFLVACVWRSPKLLLFPSFFLKNYYQIRGLFVHDPAYVVRNPMYRSVPDFNKQKKIPNKLSGLYIGQVSEYKGVFDLCEASTHVQDVSIDIAGTGPAVESIKEKYSQVTLLGYIPNTDIDQILQSYDISILPTRVYENLPTTIIESLSNGIPVVTRDIGGAGELIEPGVNGWTFKTQEELEVILTTLSKHKQSDPEYFIKMSSACRASVETLTFDHYFSEINKLLNPEL